MNDQPPPTAEEPAAERVLPEPPPANEPARHSARRWIVRLLVLAALVGAYPLLRATVWRPAPVKVDVATAAPGRVEATVTNSRAGTVKARRRSRLSPEISGRVLEVDVKEGDHVKAGQLLVRLDDSTLQAQLASSEAARTTAKAGLAEAKVRLDRAERELKRNRALAKTGVVSVDVLDAVESAERAASAAHTSAAARLEQAQAQVALAKAELIKTRLLAPFAGQVAQVSAKLGEWITPAPPLVPVPAVIDLIDPSSIYISAPMDEVDSAVIAKGKRVRVTIDPYPGKHFLGRVVRVATYVVDVEAQNRTVEIEVELDDAAFASTLLPGTSADVEVVLQARDGVLRVPASALLEGNKVLVLAGGVLVEREVGIGLKNWQWVEVTSGLKAGEQVVTSLDRAEVKAGARAVAR